MELVLSLGSYLKCSFILHYLHDTLLLYFSMFLFVTGDYSAFADVCVYLLCVFAAMSFSYGGPATILLEFVHYGEQSRLTRADRS